MTIRVKNRRVTIKPIKDKAGNEGYFIPSKEWKIIKQIITPSSKKKKPSVYPDVKEALEEMKKILKGELSAPDAKAWVKTL